MEVALLQSEEKYRSILENIEEGFFEVDLAGNFTFFNEALSRLLGYSREEMMGMNYRQYTDPETSKEVFKIFHKTYQTGEPAKEFDWLISRKDKTRRYIEANIYLKKTPRDILSAFRALPVTLPNAFNLNLRKKQLSKLSKKVRRNTEIFWKPFRKPILKLTSPVISLFSTIHCAA